ncbi:MAG TPA: IS4 family transposase, partial [Candidatus Cloacimonetes bacterium]|nr:IS4 family transposase [Candidatus Cloacimonadota bacterium]HEX37761.1 IS4 family transposase [Candidatus Cloacimonadota bacterium]
MSKTIFSQIMDFIPKYKFDKCVERYNGNYRTRNFKCWDQFLCMSFAQLSYRESLRDIDACLNAQPNKLYHMGIKGNVSISNLSRANENRDWHIYADFVQVLISKARALYNNSDLLLDIENTIYALDSTTIDLCLSLFPWAKFRKNKAAIKLHTLLDLRGSIPSFIEITTGLIHDVNILDVLIPEPGSYYIMDRGYLDYERLYRLEQAKAFFIIRAKKN